MRGLFRILLGLGALALFIGGIYGGIWFKGAPAEQPPPEKVVEKKVDPAKPADGGTCEERGLRLVACRTDDIRREKEAKSAAKPESKTDSKWPAWLPSLPEYEQGVPSYCGGTYPKIVLYRDPQQIPEGCKSATMRPTEGAIEYLDKDLNPLVREKAKGPSAGKLPTAYWVRSVGPRAVAIGIFPPKD
ncbi:MAG: hypothetical protein V4474_00905 [Patescibacteria group bacterium]